MNRILTFTYGVVAYGAFFVAFLYLIGFVGNMVVPKSIDSGEAAPPWEAILVDLVLVGLFAVQHSLMARPFFKSWWTKFVPKPVERSTYVLATSLVLALLFWQWRPMPAIIWQAEHPLAVTLLTALSLFGWIVVLYSSFIINHFDLFGLRQVYLHLRDRPYSYPPFVVKSLYRLVRHPLMFGILIAIWTTPTMTVGHLFFSVTMAAYIFLGVTLEERDLARYLGRDYDRYRSQTPRFLPLLPKRKVPGGFGPSGGNPPSL